MTLLCFNAKIDEQVIENLEANVCVGGWGR